MLRWLFVDLNSYFAAVEQQLRPGLRGKPLGVVPVKAETTCCIAASVEAKRFGVKTGTMVAEARRLCPGIRFVEARHEAYVDYHEKIVQAVESCLPVSIVMSIDEMACRLMGREQQLANAKALAMKVKKKILAVGDQLSSSVGLAPNRFLAKVASDMQKPDGLVVLDGDDIESKLLQLKPRDLPGIGPRMEKRLQRYGVATMEHLLAQQPQQLRQIWGGVGGERFYRWLRGEDLELSYSKHKSLGHSHVLPPELRNAEGAYAVTQKLLHKAGVRLRKINYWAGALSLYIRYRNGMRWGEECKMVECQDALTLMEGLQKLWQQQPKVDSVPMKVAVTLLHLVPNHEHNLSLFDDPRRLRLSRAVDAINSRFGKSSVYFAGTHAVRSAAPTRIAFSSIPDFDA